MKATRNPRFNRFELLAKLGSGSYGRVYLAHDPQLDRKVALKLVTAARGAAALSGQCMTEARAAARIAHPNVVPLFEAGLEQGIPFLVFEYVRGRPLREALGGNVGSLDAAVAHFEQIVQGMGAAHGEGVAHLDLSPNNILLDADGRLRIMDFGLSQLIGAKPTARDPDEVQGTPRYMSPEHFRDNRLDLRTDVFALGLIFFELLTGKPAFSATRFVALREQVERVDVDWRLLEDSAAPPELRALVRDAIAPDPARRFQNAQEMLAVLREAKAVRAARQNQDVAVQFLLRRLQRRPEFPAFSSSIAEINRLTADTSTASLRALADAVMRDFSLSNRLLKVANSAFFATAAGGVETVAQAIVRVGTKTVRMLCNGLLMFEHLRSRDPVLQDALVASFVAALLGRDLARVVRKDHADETFSAAMFNRLGRNLVIYYLADEYAEIRRRSAAGAPLRAAERAVLATTSNALGAAVAASWRFAPPLIASMADLPEGPLPAVTAPQDQARYLAHFPNELCETAAAEVTADPIGELETLSARYAAVFRTTPDTLAELLALALERFRDFAPGIGVNIAQSGFCTRVRQFVSSYRARQEAEAANVLA